MHYASTKSLLASIGGYQCCIEYFLIFIHSIIVGSLCYDILPYLALPTLPTLALR